jgi:hypothetical protein
MAASLRWVAHFSAADRSPNTMRLHTAFGCALSDLLATPDRLRAAGVAPLGFNGAAVDEPVVIGWMPAGSVFFNDPDGHLLEFIGIVSYSEWTMATGISEAEAPGTRK